MHIPDWLLKETSCLLPEEPVNGAEWPERVGGREAHSASADLSKEKHHGDRERGAKPLPARAGGGPA